MLFSLTIDALACCSSAAANNLLLLQKIGGGRVGGEIVISLMRSQNIPNWVPILDQFGTWNGKAFYVLLQFSSIDFGGTIGKIEEEGRGGSQFNKRYACGKVKVKDVHSSS